MAEILAFLWGKDMVIVFLILDDKEKSQNSTFKKSPTVIVGNA
jgi:hypothetical protein